MTAENDGMISFLYGVLPKRLGVILQKERETPEELRLRAGAPCTAAIGGHNFFVTEGGFSHLAQNAVFCSADDIENTLFSFCGGSVYAHEETMKRGFLTCHGIRAGISGEVSANAVIRRVDGIHFRLPRRVPHCADALAARFLSHGGGKGLLIASAPGIGKTTLLRELAIVLSNGSLAVGEPFYRVTVIDERAEIYSKAWFEGCTADVITGAGKKAAFEWAVRSLSPQIIVCDEIGSKEDAEALRLAHLGGVRVIASIHEADANALFARPSVSSLFEAGVFGAAYLLRRDGGHFDGEWLEPKAASETTA